MKLNVDMLESLVFAAAAVCQDAQFHDIPPEMRDNLTNLTCCLQRLKEDSEDSSPERWASFLAVIDVADLYFY